jgi:two-component system NarL family response regulator
MSPKIARKVIGEFQLNSISEQYVLSQREKEILKQIDAGYSYKEISNRLCISPHTVHSHIKKIYEKLQAQNRQEALSSARRKCII